MQKYWGKQIFSLRSFPEVGQKQKMEKELLLFRKKIKIIKTIYLLGMQKYWGKQIFSLGSFPRSGSKAKDGEKERREKTERW